MSKFAILHKKKDTLNRSCCIMKVTKQTLQHLRKKVPLANTIHHSTAYLCVTSGCLLFYVRNQGSSFRPFRSPIYSPTTLIFLTAPKLSGGLRSVRITPRSSEANVTELTFPNFE